MSNPSADRSMDPLNKIRAMVESLYSETGGRVYPPDLILSGWSGTERLREPLMEWLETDTQLILRLQLPGVDQRNIDVSVQGNVVTITGENREQLQSVRPQHILHHQEYVSGCFQRIIPLPFAIDKDQAKATFENGILEVTLPKANAKPKKRKRIPINAYFKI